MSNGNNNRKHNKRHHNYRHNKTIQNNQKNDNDRNAYFRVPGCEIQGYLNITTLCSLAYYRLLSGDVLLWKLATGLGYLQELDCSLSYLAKNLSRPTKFLSYLS